MSKGQLEHALEVFRQLITMNGKEPAYRLRHAEVSARLGRTQAAVSSYRVAAHLLTAAGRVAQAKAALHTAMRLDPRDLNLRRAVTDLIRGPIELGESRDDDVTEPCLIPMLD
jgi:Flp pilus assembly protein TadD